MINIFVSYSSRDREVTERFVEEISLNQVNPWFAPREIMGGSYYKERIAHGIEKSDAFILIASVSSLGDRKSGDKGSFYVRKELEIAEQYSKYIVPVSLDNTLENSRESRDFSLSLIDLQRIDIGSVLSDTKAFSAVCSHVADDLIRLISSNEVKNHSVVFLQKAEEALRNRDIVNARAAAAFLTEDGVNRSYVFLIRQITDLCQFQLDKMNTEKVHKFQSDIENILVFDEHPIGFYLLAIIDFMHYKRNAVHNPGLQIADAKSRSLTCGGVKTIHRRMARVLLDKPQEFEQLWFMS